MGMGAERFTFLFMAAISITAANFKPSTQAKLIRGLLSGEALTAGQPVRRSSGAWVAARANALGTYECEGLVVQSVGAVVPVDVVSKDPSLIIGGTVALGMVLAVGASVAGTIEPLADIGSGEFLQVIAVGKSTSVVALDCTGGLKTGVALG